MFQAYCVMYVLWSMPHFKSSDYCYLVTIVNNPASNDPWFHICSVSEFTSSISSIHVNSPARFCEKIWCADMCLPWNHEFFTWWHVRVKPYQFWPSTTRVKLIQNSWQQADHVYTHEYTWIHMNTNENTYWWSAVPILNQYDMCQRVQKWFLICWDVLIKFN